MSLAIALDQIRRPTWWGSALPGKPPRKHNKAHLGIAARQDILKTLKAAPRIGTAEVMARTRRSKSCISHNLAVMVKSGQATKVKLASGFVFELTPAGLADAE